MVLIFLLSLAFFTYAILGELERSGEVPKPAAGNCTGCGHPVEPDWLLCPHCRVLVREPCVGCGRQTATYHTFCPWCGGKGREAAS